MTSGLSLAEASELERSVVAGRSGEEHALVEFRQAGIHHGRDGGCGADGDVNNGCGDGEKAADDQKGRQEGNPGVLDAGWLGAKGDAENDGQQAKQREREYQDGEQDARPPGDG